MITAQLSIVHTIAREEIIMHYMLPKTDRIDIRITYALATRIRAYCMRTSQTMTSLICRAVDDYLKRRNY